MSGHSKWATIKRKKAANDAKRSNQFAKLLRAIEVAAREGGGDLAANMTLASAVEKAKSASVPGDNIDRAIKRGSGADADGARYEEITYEGYAPGGHRPVRRGADGQSQSHGPRRPARVHAKQRQPRRDRVDGVDVHAQGRSSWRRRRRRTTSGCWSRRSMPVPRT